MKKKVVIQTLGCKLNFAESSYLSNEFINNGIEVVDSPKNADFFILHSCTVTAIAENKCRTALRKAKAQNPSIKTAVIGCYVENDSKTLLAMDEVDSVFGNAKKYDVLDFVLSDDATMDYSEGISPVLKSDSFLPAFSSGDRTRVFLKVQDGCDHFCTYCIIPFARGHSRSQTISQTAELAKKSLAKGAKEIVLTGVNIGDFGKQNGENLLGLLKELHNIEPLKRLRISSIEPELLTDDILEFAAKSNIVQPHFHLPLQGGTDNLLKAMKRKYNTAFYKKKVEKIKSVLPNACIAMDVITGFPTETEEDFNKTKEFIKGLGVSYLHVFTYSEREGTIAQKIKPQVDMNLRRKRSRELHDISDELRLRFYLNNVGRTEDVLFETKHKDGYLHGWTGNYIAVKTNRSDVAVNTIHKVNLVDFDKEKMIFKY